MPKKRSSVGLRDDEILRFLRFSVTESGAATFTESTFDTQLSIDRGFIWLIKFVEWSLPASYIDDPAQNTSEYLTAQITRESKTDLVQMNDSDLVCQFTKEKDRSATIGTAAGPDTYLDSYPVQQFYEPPIPYAGMNIYIAIKSSAAAAKTVYGRIGYIIKAVSEKYFFRVAQALVS